MNWHQKRVLITGAGGFIGSHLVERLVGLGAKVRAFVHYNSRNDWGLLELLPDLVKDKIEVVSGDITDPFSVAKALDGCPVVFHLAALIAIPYSYIAPEQFLSVNAKGTLNLLEAARHHDIECFIHTSTSETYGTAQFTPIHEGHPLKSQSPYAASKIAADEFALSYYYSYNLPVKVIRPFNTYGPRQSARAVIPTIISQGLVGETIALGLLTPIRDLNYVSDTIEGFIKVAESQKAFGEVINVGSGRAVTIKETADIIIKLLGGQKNIVSNDDRFRPKDSEVMELLCDNRKAKELAGWAPAVTLEEGLIKCIDYIKENLWRYKPGIYNL
jgi:NAD dependent epimerase/dehydratase